MTSPRWIFVLAFTAPLCAQFDHLATNDDGSVLYFSSSLRMRGSGQYAHRKLFVADAGGVRLHTQREVQRVNEPGTTPPVSTYYSIEAAALNGDGSMVGVIARRDCYTGSGCIPVPRYRTELAGSEFRGQMSLSRNGRFAVLAADGSLLSLGALVDLSTGRRREWLEPFTFGGYGRRNVASTGVALIAGGQTGLQLASLDEITPVPVPDRPIGAVIDDAGRSAIYEAQETGSTLRRLVRIDLPTGETRLLATSSAPMQPCLSNDGQVVLFLSGGQIHVIRADGTGLRRLTENPAGIREIVLSGNGRVAYAVSGGGRLFRLDVESGTTEPIAGPGAIISGFSGIAVAGSAFAVEGLGFADAPQSAAPPLPASLDGVALLLDGRPLLLQTVAPTRVLFQLPWDIAPGAHRLEAVIETGTAFESEPVPLEIARGPVAQFERLPESFRLSAALQPYALAAHEDFRGLVTAESRARPGEIIHLYMTGLGPVEPAVETGAPAPADPPARLVLPLSCRFEPATPAEILWAGLAPGFAGYYQVSLRIPQDVQTAGGDAVLGCSIADPTSGSSAWIPIAGQ